MNHSGVTESATSVGIKQAATTAVDAVAAVNALHSQLAQDDTAVLFVFVSPDQDLRRVAQELGEAFACPIVGCTTAGEIGAGGFQAGGITAVSLAGDVNATTVALDLDQPEAQTARCQAIAKEALLGQQPGWNTFGIMLFDGLSRKEEKVGAKVLAQLPAFPIVGGSAGDNLRFLETHVLVDGKFVTNAATLTIVGIRAPIAPLRFHHFAPEPTLHVITRADPDQRTVHEIDGEPAAHAYARAIGIPCSQLGPVHYAKTPFLVNIGGEYFIRSIANARPDGSLELFCAIENGLLTQLGRGENPVGVAAEGFAAAGHRFQQTPRVVLGFDCILRNLELRASGLREQVGACYSANNVVGFSTYGECWNGVHINQTFTGLAIGGAES